MPAFSVPGLGPVVIRRFRRPDSSAAASRFRAALGGRQRKQEIIAPFASAVKKCPQKQRRTSSRRSCWHRRPATGARFSSALACPLSWPRPDIDEAPLPAETPRDTALRLAEAKARAVAARYPDGAGHRLRPGRRLRRPRRRQTRQPRPRRRTTAGAIRAGPSMFHTGVALVDAASGRCRTALVDVRSTFRDAEPTRNRRLSATARSRTTAPDPSSRKDWASRCSTGSKATTRPR